MSFPSVGLTSNALGDDIFSELRKISSPTIANAIETLHIRERRSGVTGAGIRCFSPDLGPVVGVACTATIISTSPPEQPRQVSRTEYWRYVKGTAEPVISVVQDLSEKPGGAYFGEVNARIHQSLGSLGLVTNGTVRDVPEVSRTGFHFFASGIEVSHGHAHLENFNCAVQVFGMRVVPGDIIHADMHGAVVIPRKALPDVLDAALAIERKEKTMFAACHLDDPITALDELIPPEY